jgi:hypothetical protein
MSDEMPLSKMKRMKPSGNKNMKSNNIFGCFLLRRDRAVFWTVLMLLVLDCLPFTLIHCQCGMHTLHCPNPLHQLNKSSVLRINYRFQTGALCDFRDWHRSDRRLAPYKEVDIKTTVAGLACQYPKRCRTINKAIRDLGKPLMFFVWESVSFYCRCHVEIGENNYFHL